MSEAEKKLKELHEQLKNEVLDWLTKANDNQYLPDRHFEYLKELVDNN